MKNIVFLIIGTGAGFGAGYYIGKTAIAKKENSEMEFKIAQIRNYYDDKFLALKNEYVKEKMVEDDVKNREQVEDKNEEPENKVDGAVVEANEKIVQKCNYSAFSKKNDEEEGQETMGNIHPILEPNEITEKEFYDYEDEGYRSTTVTYCSGDDTWFDADDMPMNDMRTRIGVDNLELFVSDLKTLGGEDERWVRNEMCNEVFHIYILDMTSDAYMKGR